MTGQGESDAAAMAAGLSVDQQAALTAGSDLWTVPGVEAAGIPAVSVTDGPNGARGPALPGTGEASPTTCVPCGAALGATWDPDLLREVGELLGDEARAKGCRVLLAPTVNIPRSPLAGRNFECYSEDPLLSGLLAAAFVGGVQSRGVAATVKHFVANDAERDRMTSSSVVDERTLREIYLLPFELAVRHGGALGVMTGYNRLNGTWCAEHAQLLSGILRGEWGFEGLVVTDWYAVASTVASAEAGLDVEMPGPARAYGAELARAVGEGRVAPAVLEAIARRILGVYQRIGVLADDGSPPPARPDPGRRVSVARRAAAASCVLLKNDGLLPLAGVRRVAVVGAVGSPLEIMGGGSAQVVPDPPIGLAQALGERLGAGVEVVEASGADLRRAAPRLDVPLDIELYRGHGLGGEVAHRAARPAAEVLFVGAPYGVVEGPFSVRATGQLTPPATGRYTFTMTEVGQARLLVGGEVVLSGFGQPRPRSRAFAGLGRVEIEGTVELRQGEPVPVAVEYDSDVEHGLNGFRIGWRPAAPDHLVAQAEQAAAACDAVVLVVGTGPDWESEGFDRQSLALPAGQDDLVARVVAANPRTAVVVNTGAPVQMDWADEVPAVVQAWLGGQEMGPALADVLTGAAEPAGRLAVTIPDRIEHTPAFGNFPGEHHEVRYGEGLLVGYRWYGTRRLPVRFPFGHGLSYSTFDMGEPVVTPADPGDGGTDVTVRVPVANTGARRGAEVVQCYVEPPAGPVFRPHKELKAFTKVWLDPGERAEVVLRLNRRSFAHWDVGGTTGAALRARLPTSALAPPPEHDEERGPGWRVEPGTYVLHVGRSSTDVRWRVPLEVGGWFSPSAPPGG